MKNKILQIVLFSLLQISTCTLYAQLPANVLVGYHENWGALKISQAHANYNVICLAFALPVNYPTVGYDLRYALPPAYASVAAMMTDIDLVHSQGKRVLLSIGGATGPIMITSAAEQTTFINSINTIFTTYGNKIDGLDMDLETSSMAFGATWTISAPSAGQTFMINAIKSIMATYLATNGKKMLLTMAPETTYTMGGLSTWQVTNVNGGAFLPILDGLRVELDLLHMQLYNAGGGGGGIIAWNGLTYYDTGTSDFALAMNESIVKGFTCVSGKGTFVGIPDTKVAFGLPANASGTTAGTGYVTPAAICAAAKYFKGITTTAPGGYTMNTYRPGLRGLMTWSIGQDLNYSAPAWNFAIGYTCAFSLPVELVSFTGNSNGVNSAMLEWKTATEKNNSYFDILRSQDGVQFETVGRVKGSGNSSTVNNYHFTDNDLNGDIFYYTLRQVDIDGASSQSETINIRLNNSVKADIVPSLVAIGSPINVINQVNANIISISLADITGKIYAEYDFKNNPVTNIETANLSNGLYIVRIVTKEELIIKKVMMY
jgi:chitinase